MDMINEDKIWNKIVLNVIFDDKTYIKSGYNYIHIVLITLKGHEGLLSVTPYLVIVL